MHTWSVHYYVDSSGGSPIENFLAGLNVRDRAKALAWIEQLEVAGPNLPRPYADLLEDGIHELRILLSRKQTRILYFFCHRNVIVLTHAFVKRSSRVPVREIDTAKRCREDFLRRYDASDFGDRNP